MSGVVGREDCGEGEGHGDGDDDMEEEGSSSSSGSGSDGSRSGSSSSSSSDSADEELDGEGTEVNNKGQCDQVVENSDDTENDTENYTEDALLVLNGDKREELTNGKSDIEELANGEVEGEYYEDDEDDDEEPMSSMSSSIDDDEIDQLLEEGLEESKNAGKITDDHYSEKKIVILEGVEKSKNSMDLLPAGWIEIRHASGMPVYLHRSTRVCSLSKPYFIGPVSARRHSVPLSSIPCLAYRRNLEKGKNSGGSDSKEKSSSKRKAEDEEEGDGNKNKHPKIIEEYKEEIGGVRHNENVVTSASSSDVVLGALHNAPDPSSLNDPSEETTKSAESMTTDQVPGANRCPFSKGKQDEQLENSHKAAINTGKVVDASVENSSQKAPDEEIPQGAEILDAPGLLNLPVAKVGAARDNHSLKEVSPTELQTYCTSLFNFKTITVKQFKTWGARRQHTKEQKRQALQRPTMPDGVKLISFPIHNNGTNPTEAGKLNKEYLMNPQGKSAVCILHEYVQHALRKQPSYIFRELENAATPYAATVVINQMKYGTGYGSSKKQAKSEAATATLEILIPQMKDQLGAKTDPNEEFDVLPFFEPFGLFDAGISKVCKNFSEPPPYGLLLICLQRNFGQDIGNSIKFEMIAPGPQSNKFRMEVGEHSVEVQAPNKKDGKQLASQQLLAKLHPNIKNFGAFVKLYGTNSIKSVKEKKQEEQQITSLQSKASANSPNWEILSKLKSEMLKLKEQLDKGITAPLAPVLGLGVSKPVETLSNGLAKESGDIKSDSVSD